MSEFNTIPVNPKPEKPEEDSENEEKKEPKKPDFEVEDWGAEPPAPEPDFFRTDDDVTRISPRPVIESEPAPEDREIKPESEDAQAAETLAFDQIKPGEFEKIEARPAQDVMPEEEKPAEPVFRIPEPATPIEPEVIDTPYATTPPQGATPVAGEPPKTRRTWLIVIIVLLVLCVCCVITAVVLAVLGLIPFESQMQWNSQSMIRAIIPV